MGDMMSDMNRSRLEHRERAYARFGKFTRAELGEEGDALRARLKELKERRSAINAEIEEAEDRNGEVRAVFVDDLNGDRKPDGAYGRA